MFNERFAFHARLIAFGTWTFVTDWLGFTFEFTFSFEIDFSTSFRNGTNSFFSDKGLEPNWISSPHQKGYMYISSNNMWVLPGLTILFLTLYSAFSASVRDATTILSFVGVENMRIWNHFAPKVTFLLVETSCSSISAGKKAKTKHVKMIQQQWSQWVSKLVYTTHKKRGFNLVVLRATKYLSFSTSVMILTFLKRIVHKSLVFLIKFLVAY